MKIQPVILAAGRGSKLSPISDHTPKCLLPVGNIPLLWYPLRSLDLAGFSDVIIFVLDSQKDKIENAILAMKKLVPWKTPGFSYSFSVVSSDNEDGTISVLRTIQVGEKDLLVISCDLVTTYPLRELVEAHCVFNNSLTCLMKRKAKLDIVPGAKMKNKETIVVGTDDSRRLLFIYSEADYEDAIPLNVEILNKYPKASVTTQLEDCHLYLISSGSFTSDKKMLTEITSLQSEFIPHLISKQFNSQAVVPTEESQQSVNLANLAMTLSSCSGNNTAMKCYMHEAKEKCIRANTIADYFEVNRQISAYDDYFELKEYRRMSQINYKTGQGESSNIVGEGLRIAEKSYINNSNVGSNCSIEDNVKIYNSVIMDNVTIKSGCTIQSCVVAEGSIIDGQCTLKECVVATKRKGSKISGKQVNETIADDDFDDSDN